MMEQFSFAPECDDYGRKVDQLVIQKDYEGLKVYLTQLKTFSVSHESKEYAPIFYYLGTGYGILADYQRKSQEESTKSRKWSLYYMRKALALLEQMKYEQPLLIFVYTNYANGLDACGRVIEALRIYRKAIALNSNFGMAIGNYGRALKFYANLVNDIGHSNDLHCFAYQAIKRAVRIQDPNMHEDAVAYFNKVISEYEKLPEKEYLEATIAFDGYNLGEDEERKYRLWCLNNHLFLNPLNDLIETESAFAHDPLTITQYTEYVNRDELDLKSNNEPPKWFSMLNQLKEEYIFARFLCYEGIEKKRELHYADKEVKLSLSSYDYINYSIRLEQLKTAFKNLFSMFDQIAFVINEFWNLGFGERQADAAHVFTCKNYPADNVALEALLWGYCEFCERYGNADSPSEKEIKTLRNALEHKFLKVHEYSYNGKLEIKDDKFYHISEEELQKQTIHIMELAREWIMELVYAIGIEENKNSNGENAVHMPICDYDDEWKI